jgi:uncharacterized protein
MSTAILAPMHVSELTPPEQRVLGCLLEKRWTTPDQYPLSLNSLRLACNQSTNRDPVTDYDEPTVRDAAQGMARYGLTRLASYHGSRSIKYRHLAEEALGLDRPQLAVLAVLLLRGPQTPGELKARTERMHQFGSLEQVDEVLAALGQRGYARQLPRRPGQKEERYIQLLGGEGPAGTDGPPAPAAPYTPAAPSAPAAPAAPSGPTAPAGPSLADRVAVLEAEVAALREQIRSVAPAPPGT